MQSITASQNYCTLSRGFRHSSQLTAAATAHRHSPHFEAYQIVIARRITISFAGTGNTGLKELFIFRQLHQWLQWRLLCETTAFWKQGMGLSFSVTNDKGTENVKFKHTHVIKTSQIQIIFNLNCDRIADPHGTLWGKFLPLEQSSIHQQLQYFPRICALLSVLFIL